jgi:pimeloyl-ACP methyl ester carboxylesterase/DNA-binding CsgD family transcriptional regulator
MRQEIRFCTAPDGVRLAYATAGTGPFIVRVANYFTHLELDWESAVWRHWLEALASDYTLIRYDLRGSGLSDRGVDNLSLDIWVEDLKTVVDKAGLTRFPLIGLCQGGAIAVAFAARYPERVSSLVLYDSYVKGAFADGAPPQTRADAEALARMIEVGWGRDIAAFREVFANLLMPDASPQRARELAELQRCAATPEDACRLWEAFHTIDISEQATRVAAPTLVFHVLGDAMIPFEEGRRLAALIPRARFVPLEGRNHILLETELAWQTFLLEVKLFLEPDTPVTPFHNLTEREREVLNLIAQGLSNDAIAERLMRSPATVRNHITSIFSKLGVKDRAQAIVEAREAGLGRRASSNGADRT